MSVSPHRAFASADLIGERAESSHSPSSLPHVGARLRQLLITLHPSSMLNLVPSNTQLTIALLREAEAAGTPLPPPPPPPLAADKAATTAATSKDPAIPSQPRAPRGTGAESVSSGEEEAYVQAPISAPLPKKSNKEKFASFVKTSTKLAETGAGYVAGEKKLDWEKVSRVSLASQAFVELRLTFPSA